MRRIEFSAKRCISLSWNNNHKVLENANVIGIYNFAILAFKMWPAVKVECRNSISQSKFKLKIPKLNETTQLSIKKIQRVAPIFSQTIIKKLLYKTTNQFKFHTIITFSSANYLIDKLFSWFIKLLPFTCPSTCLNQAAFKTWFHFNPLK